MIDLIYLTYNRLRFTQESLQSLVENTNWDFVDRIIFYDDGSSDGTFEHIFEKMRDFEKAKVHFQTNILRNPVAVMNHFLEQPQGQPVFCKMDSDVIVPPGWLDRCMTVMENNPELGLLGIEPAASRKPAPTTHRRIAGHNPIELTMPASAPGYVACDSIGGIGLMRREVFKIGHGMHPHSTYGGFTDWQIAQKTVIKGWVAPALKLFLLDRMPMDPWKSLSLDYISKKWQRPWRDYSLDDAGALWDWWKPAYV